MGSPPHTGLSVSPVCTRTWTLDADLDLYRRLGVERVSLSLETLEAAGDVGGACARVVEAGLAVELVYPLRSFELADPASWPEVVEVWLAALDAATAVGGRGLLTCGGAARGMAAEEAAAAFADAVSPVVRVADERGLRVLLEPVRPEFARLGFVHTVRDAAALARRCGLGLAVDTAHSWWEPALAATLTDAGELLGIVQVADLETEPMPMRRAVPGEGDLRLAALLDTFVSAGYRGAFEVELLGPVVDTLGPEEALRRSLATLGQMLAGLSPGGERSG